MVTIQDVVNQCKQEIINAVTLQEINTLKIKYLGKRGVFSSKFKELISLNLENRAIIGRLMNNCKNDLLNALKSKRNELEKKALDAQLSRESIDITLPGRRLENGGLHPITQAIERIKCFFCGIGFTVVQGPEIEDGFHCFDALNMPKHHPARDSQDTFYFNPGIMLRPHTSSVQIRAMETQTPPLRLIAPGRVYRNDYDMTHTPMFHQVECLFIDRNASLAQLKGLLHSFLDNFFEESLKIRFRPSFFPFVEPGAEVDVMGKNGKWLEVLGCGIVHPNVLKSANINTEEFSGFAFGMGVERLTMLRYGVSDLRDFFENDIRFLKQFN
ncbi:TPA: phenylalanine--tRNA ligase subunit alpha [Salmonella enterica]